MCGIAAIYAYENSAPPVDRAELLRIRDHMVTRGPDGFGDWYSGDNRVGLAHRRLSIIDLSDIAAQPMTNDDGSLIITYNGEIYNYNVLRERLKAKGCHFRSHSDTEVLLHLYAEKGPEMVHELRGMYAFAIWDARKECLFIARDPFGIKPLYYSDDGHTFRLASQVKALLAGRGIDTSSDPAGHVGFFLWGHVPEPYTLYKKIRMLPPGCSFMVNRQGFRKLTTFCSIPNELARSEIEPFDGDRGTMLKRLRAALLDSVRHHLVADVPVGVFLSSGLDSATLAALASETGGSLKTITLGFEEYRGTGKDEVPLAEEVAHLYGAEHQTIWVRKEDFQSDFAELINSMDQPTTDGVNTYFVSKAATQAGLKVAISGLGGDELFGGYPSFRQIPKMIKLLRPVSLVPGVGKGFRAVCAPVLKHFTSPKYAGILEYGGSVGSAYLLRRGMFMPWELPDVLDVEIVREGWKELETLVRLDETVAGITSEHLQVSALETTWYMRNQLLRDTDWTSMAHSLEIRVPLVDIVLLRTVIAAIGNGYSLNKQDMALTPQRPLQPAILNRQKTGFSIPVQEWLRAAQGQTENMTDRGLRGWAKQVYSVATGVNKP